MKIQRLTVVCVLLFYSMSGLFVMNTLEYIELEQRLDLIHYSLETKINTLDEEYKKNGHTEKWRSLHNECLFFINKYNGLHNQLLKLKNADDQDSDKENNT